MPRESSRDGRSGLQSDPVELADGALQALEQFQVHGAGDPGAGEVPRDALGLGAVQGDGESAGGLHWIRRWKLPIFLLIASVLSMTWAGLTMWSPVEAIEAAVYDGSLFDVRRSILANCPRRHH